MKLYNTLSRQTEELKPIDPPKTTVYTCGPTVYDYPHIGNWFTFIRYDVLIRTIRAAGFKPDWVMNITDVGHLISDADEGEDKLEKGARREGKTAWDIADFYTDYFLKALDRLNMFQPDHLPRATALIPEQIALVQRLEEKGFTYTIDDGVYFDTSKLNDYGKLARLDIEHLREGARVEENPQKRNATDFALWKFSPKGQKRDMEWWSPWTKPGENSEETHRIGEPRTTHLSAEFVFSASSAGSRIDDTVSEQHSGKTDSVPKASEQGELGSAGSDAVRGSWGFPGWHLECSAMAMKYLGETIDIHGGGIDHIPVHHTNEIAQSEAATGKPFAHYWFHSNFILVDGKKMSKSLGNFYTLEDIEAKGFDLMAFRLLVLESHYRTEANFSWETLEAAQNRLKKWQAFADLKWQPVQAAAPQTFKDQVVFKNAQHSVKEQLADDLNTPQTITWLDRLSDEVEFVPKRHTQSFEALLKFFDKVFGLGLSTREDVAKDIKDILTERQKARESKDWGKSDDLRNQLEEQGIAVKDTPYGQIWSRA